MASINSINNAVANNTLTLNSTTANALSSTTSAVDYNAILYNTQAGTTGSYIQLAKSRTGGAITTGDVIGKMAFFAHDGSAYIQAAAISSTSSGTIAANRVGSSLDLATHPDSTSAMATRMNIASTGMVTVNPPDTGAGTIALRVGGSSSGDTMLIQSLNSSNTASSQARIDVQVAGGTAGDAYQTMQITGGQAYSFGVDNSDSDAFVLAGSLVLGTTNVMRVATTGEINYPLQSAFSAYLGTTVTNVTGTGTAFTLGTTTALTEVFDQNGDFVTSGTFTAPVTGRYMLSAGAIVTGATIATFISLTLISSNRSYNTQYGKAAGTQILGANLSVFADMDAADTCTVTVATTGEAGDTDDVVGGSTVQTFFAGYLVC